jgi:hypothetical protein
MADLFLTWDEAQGEQLPHYCVSCARPATEWADWRICKTEHHVFSIQTTHINVTLPVCPQHRNLSWIYWRRVIAKQIQDDGIILSHVSPGFALAVWDYREEMESQPGPVHQAASVPRSRRSEFEDEFHESLPRHRPRHDRYVQTPSGWTPGKIVLLVFIVLLLAPCTLILLFGFLFGVLRGVM